MTSSFSLSELISHGQSTNWTRILTILEPGCCKNRSSCSSTEKEVLIHAPLHSVPALFRWFGVRVSAWNVYITSREKLQLNDRIFRIYLSNNQPISRTRNTTWLPGPSRTNELKLHFLDHISHRPHMPRSLYHPDLCLSLSAFNPGKIILLI